MGRGDEQKPVSDGDQYWFQIFRNVTSPKQWYLQIGMLDVCVSLESTLITSILWHEKFWFLVEDSAALLKKLT